ncbi:carbohydrate esterase family 4 protein [Butyriboletus roseoflavus]|nr:carbohydrate esterase family 4 protein [Butyriboletus roseoflavus]
MHLKAVVALFALVAAVDANDRHARFAKRQSASTTTSSSVSSSASSTASAAASTSSGSASPVPTTPVGTTIPPLNQITSGMATPSTLPVTATYPAGATPPISGAPPLPTPFVFVASQWPPQDQIAPTNTSDVAQWMTELNGFDIPDLSPTTDGTCANNPTAVSEAAARGWWTCGGYTRATDITACPRLLTWGVSFDDGPAFYSEELLDYLSSKNLKSTFFTIGSRVVERPTVLVEEYMSGHEIAVHTWSHRPLTSLTTEQVVAELGYTRKVIKQVLGVTPTLMRPPYGDIDDRVRGISLAMGMIPVIWTRTPSGATFDTNDWRVPGGSVSGNQSYSTFLAILSNATTLTSGFIVLEHDLYAQTVDLAIGYTLPAAQSFTPSLTLNSIGQCMGIPSTNLYRESNQNSSFPYPNTTLAATNGTGGASGASTNGGATLNPAISLSAGIAALLAVAVSLL